MTEHEKLQQEIKMLNEIIENKDAYIEELETENEDLEKYKTAFELNYLMSHGRSPDDESSAN